MVLMTTRTPGLRGRLPAKPPGERFNIGWVSQYLREPLPAPVYPIDVTGGIGTTSWGMDGNGPDPTCTTYPDGVGDCGYAARQHARMSKAACYGQTEVWETSDALVAEYLLYDNGHDVGVNLADVLLAWWRAGRILAFAPVDHTDPAAVDSAMQAFKGVIVGVNLTDDANQLFSEGLPWTVAGGQQPDPAEGHAIVKVKADGQALDGYVSWGALQGATTGWSEACQIECWALITSEDEAAKLNMPALLADIDALGGTSPTPVPVPVPPPTPVPVPPPAPVPVTPPVPPPAGLLQALRLRVEQVGAATGRNYAEVLDWLRAHRP